ncbi:MAG: hypothetical protein V9F00_03385 [Nocardioides sp.]
MDLYKHAFRLSPLIDSDVIADCFELAWDIRIMDMRAAPYDLSGLRLDPTGDEWTPLLIETPEGKAEYVAAQRAFAKRGQALRLRLIDQCERLLSSSAPWHRRARSSGRRASKSAQTSPPVVTGNGDLTAKGPTGDSGPARSRP